MSLIAHLNPLKRIKNCFVPVKFGKRVYDQGNRVFCWTMIDNQREKRERCATHSKNTELHYHKVDFELSTKALLVSF